MMLGDHGIKEAQKRHKRGTKEIKISMVNIDGAGSGNI
jgi:hypothetical protein